MFLQSGFFESPRPVMIGLLFRGESCMWMRYLCLTILAAGWDQPLGPVFSERRKTTGPGGARCGRPCPSPQWFLGEEFMILPSFWPAGRSQAAPSPAAIGTLLRRVTFDLIACGAHPGGLDVPARCCPGAWVKVISVLTSRGYGERWAATGRLARFASMATNSTRLGRCRLSRLRH